MTAVPVARDRDLVSLVREWRPLRPPARDSLLAVGVLLVDLVVFSGVTTGDVGAGELAFAVLGSAPLAWRAHAPVPTFFAVWILTLVAGLVFTGLRPTLGLLVALYTVASRSNPRTTFVAVAVSAPTAVAVALKHELPQNDAEDAVTIALAVGVLMTLLVVASAGLGRWVSRSRSRLERQQQAAAEARVEERRLIALELHDILSHSVSVMVVQADGARAVLASAPERADHALEHISQVGRASVGELRRLLGVLVDGSIDPDADYGARAGLADLPRLVDEARRTGLTVQLETHGHPHPLPESFERSVHRIVKECLTNSLKHAGPGTAVTVTLVWGETALVVEVVDDGGTSHDDRGLSTGHGLAALRERVQAMDGRLDAGPVDHGSGYAVTATLPLQSSP